jgi:hypothetical protein
VAQTFHQSRFHAKPEALGPVAWLCRSLRVRLSLSAKWQWHENTNVSRAVVAAINLYSVRTRDTWKRENSLKNETVFLIWLVTSTQGATEGNMHNTIYMYTPVTKEPGYRSRYNHWLRAGRLRGRNSSPGWVKNFIHVVQTGSGILPVSYPMGTGSSLPGGKAAGALSWPLTSS